MIKWGARPEQSGWALICLPIECAEAGVYVPRSVTMLCRQRRGVEVRARSFDIVLQSMVLTSVLDSASARRWPTSMLDAVRHAAGSSSGTTIT